MGGAGWPVAAHAHTLSQEIGTPGVIPDGSGALAYTLDSTPPAGILERLNGAAITTPLLPAFITPVSLGPVTLVDDPAIVGDLSVVMDAETIPVGAFTVTVDRSAARARIDAQRSLAIPSTDIRLGEFDGLLWRTPDGPVAMVQAGPVLVSGFGVPAERTTSLRDAAVDFVAMSIAIALLDHLNRVMSTSRS